MTVDRAALIEAAAGSLGGCGCTEADGTPCANCRLDASHMLDAILPLIADAIDAKRDESARWFRSMPRDGRLTTARANGSADAYRHCAELVRSLLGDTASMTLYVADVERALGMDAPVPHKLGGNDGNSDE